MNPEIVQQAAQKAQEAALQSQDPVLVGLGWVFAVILMLIAIAKPVMGILRQYQTNKADGAKDGADAALFKQLQQQIEVNAKDIRQLIDDRNHWHEEYLTLKSRVAHLEGCEAAMDRMKAKLDQKDIELRERDAENRHLMLEIIQLKDRLHALELRLSEDEKSFCSNCEYRK